MKKFKFSLDKMLSYERQMLDKEKNMLITLVAKRDGIEAKIAELELDMENRYKEYLKKSQESIILLDIQSYTFFKDNTMKHLKFMKQELLVANTSVEGQRKIVILASQNVEKIVKLEENQKEEYDYNMRKYETGIIEEMISSDIARKTED